MRYIIAPVLATLMTTPALAEVPDVVADIPPVHALVAQVMGDLGAPILILERGASEHDFQLRPSQAAALADADLVVWVGPELTPWLDRALDSLGGNVARLGLLAADGTDRRSYITGGPDDHADRDDPAATAEDGHDHAAEGTDPHAWLDPSNAKVWLGLIATELSMLDPENAATYDANATKASDGIDALDRKVATLLTPAQDKTLVMFHDAYGYFAAHYGLTLGGSVAVGDASAPGAQRLSELQAALAGTACIYPEAQHDDALITQLATGTDVRIGAPLDPNGSTLEPGPDLYATLMTTLASTITDCLTQ
jgi:zinc transport system substrate-binding protein